MSGSAPPPQAAASSSSWSGFLKTIASFNGDISSITAPPFILSPVSLTEYSAYWVSDPALLTAPAREQDPEKRAVLVLKWFISTLKQQYSSRNEKLGSEKKPLNPFLGELFLARWGKEGEDGSLQLVSEQVSHHPPVTAYAIWDKQRSVKLQGYNGQKASVSKSLSINIKQVGHALLEIPEYKETYLITLPALHIEGVISGSPYVELNGHSWIVSSSGFVSKISYSGKGWLSGTKNSFTASLWRKGGSPKQPLYTADGQWTGAFCIKSGADKQQVDAYDPHGAGAGGIVLPTVADIEQQEPLESRRAWQKVAEGIKRSDMDTVGREKSRIEEEQRALRRKEKETGTEWQRRFFVRQQNLPVFEQLARDGETEETLSPDKTDGVWVWNEKEA